MPRGSRWYSRTARCCKIELYQKASPGSVCMRSRSMSRMDVEVEPENNLAELLKKLGVSAARVRLEPPPGTAVEADVVKAMEAPRKRLCELIDGVLVEKAMGFSESILAGI